MPNRNVLIFHVDNPTASATFYAGLLDRPPLEASPTFVLFALPSGLMLGLWCRHTVAPAAVAHVGGTELAFTVEGRDGVDALHATWTGRGLTILQAPTDMDFGRTFVATDPDGHRLRVFAPLST